MGTKLIHYRKIIFLLLGMLSSSFLAYANEKVCFSKVCVDAQVAQDMSALIHGMNSKESIKENEGMLYVLPPLSPASFTTKGMQFPIDIIWIDENKKVIVMARNLEPCLEEACPLYVPPNGYAPYVLEVNAGFSKANDIKVGDHVKF